MRKKKGIVLTVKKYRELGFKRFMKKWGDGINGVTPLQTTVITLIFFIPIIAGLVWGLISTIFMKMYWLALVLAGSLPITLLQIVGTYQKYRKLKEVEKILKELEK
jgi:hypothetical protein